MKNVYILYASIEEASMALGLGVELVPIDEWTHKPNTIYIGIGNEVFNRVAESVHLGLRGSGFWNAVSMKRVGLNDGSDYIFCTGDAEQINDAIRRANDPDLDTPNSTINVPEEEIITDIDRAVEVFEYLTNMPIEEWFGYDFESNSFPNCSDFILTGLGISTLTESFWFDFRYLCDVQRPTIAAYEENIPDKKLNRLNEAHRKFLRVHSNRCIVFSVQFELFATYRYLKEMFYYKDLNVMNIMDGEGIWNNLKYTVRKKENVNSWDDEFDDLNAGEYINEETGELDFDALQKNHNWLSDEDIEEMKSLYRVCQSPFYIIPARWLGKYCCKDSYYTLVTWIDWLPRFNYKGTDLRTIGDRLDKLPTFPIEDRWKVLSEAAIDIYCDGKLAEAIVNRAGMLMDSKILDKYTELHYRILLNSVTGCGVYYYTRKMAELEDKVTPLDQFTPFAAKLIKEGWDISQDPFYLSKELLSDRYYDENFEGCFNTNKVYEDFGQEVGQEFIDIIWDYTDTLEGVRRKRSIHEAIAVILQRELGLNEEQLSHFASTIEYYGHKSNLDYFENLPWRGVPYDEYESTYQINGETYTLEDCYNHLMEIFNNNTAQSDLEYLAFQHIGDDIYFWIFSYYYEDIFKRLNTGDVLKDLENFRNHAEDLITPEELDLAIQKDGDHEDCLGWFFEGNICWSMCWWLYPNYSEELFRMVRTADVSHPVFGAYIATALCRAFAKYAKTLTYYVGLYKEENTYHASIDDLWIPNFSTDKGNYEFAHPYFTANSQYSFRWSSNFHTIPSRNDMKRCVGTPDNALFAYFDISSMEIRQIAYLSRDKNLVELFESKQDVYMYCAHRLLGEAFDKLDDEEKADYRSNFKVIFLAYFYLRSAFSLAPELDKSIDETQALMDSLGDTFSEALEFRKYVSEYPLTHDGRLLMPFGETIITEEEDPKRNQRHGINTLIQGSSAVMLVLGFFNCFREAQKQGKKLRHIGFVHDSSQTYFEVGMLWEALDFFYTNVTKFLYDRFRVNMAFDVKVGSNYFDVCGLSQISEDTIQLKGNSRSINGILNRLRMNNIPFEIIDADKFEFNEDGFLSEVYKDPLLDFCLDTSQTVDEMDESDVVKMKLRKL